MTEHGDFEKPHVHAQTAFIVVVDESGKAFAVLQPPDGVAVNYLPDATSVRRACSEIVDDINAQITAEYTAQHVAALLKKEDEKPADSVRRAMEKRNAFRRGAHEAQDANLAHYEGEWIG